MKKVLKDAIEDLLITALEGGSNYWYYLPLNNIEDVRKDTKSSLSENISSYILSNGTIEVYDVENPAEKLGEINLTSIKKGFDKMHDNWSMMYGSILEGDIDADIADVWFQLSVMGEVVFS